MMNNMKIKMPNIFGINEVTRFREEFYLNFNNSVIHLELDFSNCSFIDSTGLGVLVSIFKKIKENEGELVLLNMSTDVLKVFQMTRLDKVFTIR